MLPFSRSNLFSKQLQFLFKNKKWFYSQLFNENFTLLFYQLTLKIIFIKY